MVPNSTTAMFNPKTHTAVTAAASRQPGSGKRRSRCPAISSTAKAVITAATACGVRQVSPNTRIQPAFQ